MSEPTITSPVSAPPVPPATSDDSPIAVWTRRNPFQIRSVQTGLKLVYHGICLGLVGMFLLPIVMLSGKSESPWVLTLSVVAVVCMIGGAAMQFVGPIRCLAVPDDSDLKRPIVVTVVLCFVLLMPLAALAFVHFLRRLALSIRRPDLAERAKALFWAVLVIDLIDCAVFVCLATADLLQSGVALFFSCVSAVAGLVVLVQFAKLVNSIASVLRVTTRK
ncbi:MAG: hypothetical protein K8T25_15350 [Planctomycetia bacterium]|nr:hypothetical protein [Planctomycetia bacterium]